MTTQAAVDQTKVEILDRSLTTPARNLYQRELAAHEGKTINSPQPVADSLMQELVQAGLVEVVDKSRWRVRVVPWKEIHERRHQRGNHSGGASHDDEQHFDRGTAAAV